MKYSDQNQEDKQRNGYGALTRLFLEPLIYFEACYVFLSLELVLITVSCI